MTQVYEYDEMTFQDSAGTENVLSLNVRIAITGNVVVIRLNQSTTVHTLTTGGYASVFSPVLNIPLTTGMTKIKEFSSLCYIRDNTATTDYPALVTYDTTTNKLVFSFIPSSQTFVNGGQHVLYDTSFTLIVG
jgi:hypothetical protein